MAKVLGSPFGEGEHPIIGKAVQFHDTGSVQRVSVPRNPRTPSQQLQRLRLAEATEGLRLIGVVWKDWLLDRYGGTNPSRWHAAYVGSLSYKNSAVRVLWSVLAGEIGESGLESWNAKATDAGLVAVETLGTAGTSAGMILLLMAAYAWELQVDFELFGERPSAENASGWVDSYVS